MQAFTVVTGLAAPLDRASFPNSFLNPLNVLALVSICLMSGVIWTKATMVRIVANVR